MGLADLEKQASPEAVRLATRILEADIAGRAWVDQVGLSLTAAQVAELLGRSEQAISGDGRLLRLERSDGEAAYSAFQFDGRRQLPGVADVMRVLSGSLTPGGTAAWLTGISPALGERRPLDVLAGGDIAAVLTIAKRMSSTEPGRRLAAG